MDTEPPYVSLEYEGRFPDKIKVKKALTVWPVVFTASGAWDRELQQFNHKFSCKDLFIKGKLDYNFASKVLEYRKRFHISIPHIPTSTSLIVSTQWHFGDAALMSMSWKPRLQWRLETHSLGHGNIQYQPLATLAARKKIYFMKHIGLEVQGWATLKVPQQLQFQHDDHPQDNSDSASPVQLNVRELNLVFRL